MVLDVGGDLGVGSVEGRLVLKVDALRPHTQFIQNINWDGRKTGPDCWSLVSDAAQLDQSASPGSLRAQATMSPAILCAGRRDSGCRKIVALISGRTNDHIAGSLRSNGHIEARAHGEVLRIKNPAQQAEVSKSKRRCNCAARN